MTEVLGEEMKSRRTLISPLVYCATGRSRRLIIECYWVGASPSVFGLVLFCEITIS
jgi:hypothetical protein